MAAARLQIEHQSSGTLGSLTTLRGHPSSFALYQNLNLYELEVGIPLPLPEKQDTRSVSETNA